MTIIITLEYGIHQVKPFTYINASIHLLRIFFYYKNEYFNKRVLAVSCPRFLKYGVSPCPCCIRVTYPCPYFLDSHSCKAETTWLFAHSISFFFLLYFFGVNN